MSPSSTTQIVRSRPTGLGAWLLRRPLVVSLPVQAALLLYDLGRLPVWGDEQASLDRAGLPAGELARALGANVHPPLYFLLLKLWLRLPWAADGIVRARALSALCVLVATVVIDRCWLRELDDRRRAWFLVLWTLSPALLLYGRIARSYALQLLLASVALYAGQRYAQRFSGARLLAYAIAASALLYTHYLPGLAVIGAVAMIELWQVMRNRDPRRLVRVAAPLLLIAVALAAWSSLFAAAVERVGDATPYQIVGNTWLDALAALAYTFVSFTVGETVRPWMIVAFVVLAPAVLLVLVRGLRAQPSWLPLVLLTAVVGFIGARHWVSFAFVAPRLLFLLPFYLLLLVGGSRGLERARVTIFTGLACVYLGGIGAYVEQAGFLNKAYVIPSAAISRAIRAGSANRPSIVILDHHSTSLRAVEHDLPVGTRILQLQDRRSMEDAVRLSEQDDVGLVWFARNAHDGSAEHWSDRVEAAFARQFTVRRTGFAPYSALDQWLMDLAGWTVQPANVIELLEMRRTDPTR